MWDVTLRLQLNLLVIGLLILMKGGEIGPEGARLHAPSVNLS